ncbi:hypothetical protein ACTVJH_05770 [Desulfoplanes sp. PS50]
MIPFPAVCDQCGRSFIDAFGGTLEGRIALKGQDRPGCPGCGGNVSLPNGRYGFAGHLIRLLSRPCVQEADLRNLDGLMADLEQGNIALAECITGIGSGHQKFLFLSSLYAWYARSSEPGVRMLAGLFRDMIAAVLAYFPGRVTNFESFEHAANEHFILAWDSKGEEQKAALETLVLASIDDQQSEDGRLKMDRLKKARQRLKQRKKKGVN